MTCPIHNPTYTINNVTVTYETYTGTPYTCTCPKEDEKIEKIPEIGQNPTLRRKINELIEVINKLS